VPVSAKPTLLDAGSAVNVCCWAMQMDAVHIGKMSIKDLATFLIGYVS
jgi:hypothetical protein